MRFTFVILLFCCLGADAQMIIKAHANYRPYAVAVAQNLLLDDYSGAAAAYSLRKLDKDYTGSAIRVRRSNDNSEQDIGFVGNDLDTASLKTFVGANSGFVTTWYDQSGNARNATQTTAANQPRIINAGTVERENTKVTIFFDGTNDNLIGASNSYLTNVNQGFISSVNKRNVNNNTQAFIIQFRTSNLLSRAILSYRLAAAGNQGISASGRRLDTDGFQAIGTNIFNGNLLLLSAHFNWQNALLNVYENGLGAGTLSPFQTAGNTSNTNGDFFIGCGSGTEHYLNGKISEIIVWSGTDQSSNRTGIENNINDYYNIYWNGDFAGLLDSFPSSAASYSLRNLDKDYLGPLVRVRRSNDNAEQDIFGDYYGNLDTASLKTFVGTGNSGFVTVWYNQADSAGIFGTKNATQTTAANQPRIINAGIVERQNGKVSIRLDGTNDGLIISTAVPLTSHSIFDVKTTTNTITTATSAMLTYSGEFAWSSTYDETLYGYGSLTGRLTNERQYFTNSAVSTENPAANDIFGYGQVSNNISGIKLNSILYNGNTTFNFYENNSLISLSNTDAGAFSSTRFPNDIKGIGYRFSSNTFYFNGNFQEIIIYNSDQSSNRTGIQTNINTYYSIY
jgi:hypothetical protein